MSDHLHATAPWLAAGRWASRTMRAARELLLRGQLRGRRAHVQRACGWCNSKIPAGRTTRDDVAKTLRLSHGICPSCVAALIAAHPHPPLSGELPSRDRPRRRAARIWAAAGGVGSAAVDLVLVIGCIAYMAGRYIMGLLLRTRWHL